jgi:uncharacterized protein (DUF4213/DUF364 family)
MSILDDLLLSLGADAPVRSVLVGAHWTVVCSRHCGLASTLIGEKPHGHERVREVGSLHLKTAHQLAELARSDNLLEASIGVAAINSLIDVKRESVLESNARDVLAERGRGRTAALVGHFPFIVELRPLTRELWVIEQRPSEGEHPPEAAADLIPQADVVAITGTALINHTLEGLLALCRPETFVMILGPSTPLSPVLFEHGVAMLSGAGVVDEEAAMRTISQGATFQQVEGVRLVAMSKEKAGPGLLA